MHSYDQDNKLGSSKIATVIACTVAQYYCKANACPHKAVGGIIVCTNVKVSLACSLLYARLVALPLYSGSHGMMCSKPPRAITQFHFCTQPYFQGGVQVYVNYV